MEENGDRNQADTIACRTCREPIRRGARKCVRCDSFQDWRRFMSVSTSALALLIALISVVSATGPGIKRLMIGDRSDLRFSYLATVDEGMIFLVSNSGTRPGVVVGAGTGRPDFINLRLRADNGRRYHIIQAGEVKSIIVELEVTGNPEGAYAEFMQTDPHLIQLYVREFGGERDHSEVPVAREELFPLVLEGKDRILQQRAAEAQRAGDRGEQPDAELPKHIRDALE